MTYNIQATSMKLKYLQQAHHYNAEYISVKLYIVQLSVTCSIHMHPIYPYTYPYAFMLLLYCGFIMFRKLGPTKWVISQ